MATLSSNQQCGRSSDPWFRRSYGVQLTSEERAGLRQWIRSGQHSARVITRARILLRTERGEQRDLQPRCCAPNGATPRWDWTACCTTIRQANRYRKLDDKGEAYLIALACSDAPEGHDHWTLRLLADQAVELGLVESLSHETVRLRLKKTSSSRGGSSSGASPR